MRTEYAVQTRTFVDGPFDCTYTREFAYSEAPFNLESAQKRADSYNRLHNGKYVIARVVSREVTEWEPV